MLQQQAGYPAGAIMRTEWLERESVARTAAYNPLIFETDRARQSSAVIFG